MTHSLFRWVFWPLAITLFMVLTTGRVQAATVILMRPTAPASVTAEALVRMHGELVAAGFDVQVIATSSESDPRKNLEQRAKTANVDAVVAILGEASADFIEVWVIDQVTGKSVVRRIPSEPLSNRAAEILAIRALELLRASFLEIAMRANPALPSRERTAPKEVARLLEDTLDPRRSSSTAIELGGGLLSSFDGIDPALLPMLRLALALSEHGMARISVAGLGSRPRVEKSSMLARVAQQFLLLEAGIRSRRQRVQPFFSLGAGVLHTAAEGQASWPYQALSAARWSFLADAGLGIWVALVGRYEAAIELHVELALPYPTLRFLNTEVATSGRPNLLLTLTLMAWL